MFKGVYTAIVTPFNADGSIAWETFAQLIEAQVAGGVDGIVPVGTTGESPTLSPEEHPKVIEFAIQQAAKRIQVIAGTGANSTAEAIELTQHAKAAGADGTLQVTPYYNKPNFAGLKAHFSTVADIGLPVMLYNVPGRSAAEIPLELVYELAEHPSIVSIKEAAPDSVSRVTKIKANTNLSILSGDDPMTLPMMILGGSGVVSVASNIVPKEVSDMVHFAQKGDWAHACEMHHDYHRLFEAVLSSDTNPIPIKTALSLTGQIKNIYRLPLAPTTETTRAYIEQTLSDYNLI